MVFEFEPIGYLETCFKEKFGIPRQSGLADKAWGKLKLGSHPDFRIALKGLEGFSHLWLVFVFHERGSPCWRASIRPPRLGGSKKVGVLASRSPHRPNPIGMSVVKIEGIDLDAVGGPEVHVSGVDLLDATPVLDIKPYLPYADSVPHALAGWAVDPIDRKKVHITPLAQKALALREVKYPGLTHLVTQMLELDPRPAFQQLRVPADSPTAPGTQYGFKVFDYDVKWEIGAEGIFVVTDIVDQVPKD